MAGFFPVVHIGPVSIPFHTCNFSRSIVLDCSPRHSELECLRASTINSKAKKKQFWQTHSLLDALTLPFPSLLLKGN